MTQRSDKKTAFNTGCADLVEFMKARPLPATGIDAGTFWAGLSDLVQ